MLDNCNDFDDKSPQARPGNPYIQPMAQNPLAAPPLLAVIPMPQSEPARDLGGLRLQPGVQVGLWTVVGQCGKCGAPVYAKPNRDRQLPPVTHRGCECGP